MNQIAPHSAPPGQPDPPHRRISKRRLSQLAAAGLITLAGVLWFVTVKPVGRVTPATPTSTAADSVTPRATVATPALHLSVGPAPAAPLAVPPGYAIHVFADHLGMARDLAFSPDGTLLLSDPKAATITALPDTNHDGAADYAKVVLTGGTNPHGLAFHGGYLYVAETNRLVRYNWNEADLTATGLQELFKLPSPNPDHNKRTITFDASGRMYVSVGSTCDVCNEADPHSATILTADADGKNLQVFATGLRNAPFMAFNPTTKELWATEMGRDYLGDNLPPDEIDIIKAGGNYGWPICYGNKIHDTKFDTNTYIRDPCADTVAPIYGVPAHNAPLGLAFIQSEQFPAGQQGDLLVAYHGSWNRTVPDGYKVVRLSVSGSTVTGTSDFITGFIGDRTVFARPVDLAFDDQGSLYLSDDKAGAVYIIQKQP